MPLTHFPHGVSSFGMPQLGSGGHTTTGNVYFVGSAISGASNSNAGTDPDHPLATLNGAYDKVTANQGDIVFFMPNHAEDITSATTQVLDVAGVKLVGLGYGTDRPTFTYTTTTGVLEIDSANTYIENFVFNASIAAVALAIAVEADHVTLMNCQFGVDADGTDAFYRTIQATNVDHTRVENCNFYNGLTQTDTAIQELFYTAACEHMRIIGNVIQGYWWTAVFNGVTFTDTADFRTGFSAGTTTLSKDLMILHNNIYNRNTETAIFSATLGWHVDINTASTGMLAYNNFASPGSSGGTGNMLDPGSLICIENYASNAVDKTGVPVPSAAAITST